MGEAHPCARAGLICFKPANFPPRSKTERARICARHLAAQQASGEVCVQVTRTRCPRTIVILAGGLAAGVLMPAIAGKMYFATCMIGNFAAQKRLQLGRKAA
jgi:hypothetical protein